jgi:hypothetical protein
MNPETRASIAVVAVLLLASAAPAKPPPQALEVVPFRPAGISSPEFESHAAFDARTGELYFVRSSPAFEGWRIFVSSCTGTGAGKGWSAPKPAPFAGDGVEADPWLTTDGDTLYFISTRTTDGISRKDLDIWLVERRADGAWGTPVRLPEPVNSTAPEWFPRLSADGWLYYGSSRPGGLGGTDVWRARQDRDGKWTIENLGASINTPGDEYEPLPSPDGSRLIVMADGDLYESRRTQDGWSPRTALGPDVNTDALEIGAVFSPSGRSLLFARDTGAPHSGELFVWRTSGPEAWPPDCGVPKE